MKYELIIYIGEDCEGARRKKGDIIDVRKPLGVLGKKEEKDHILKIIDIDELTAIRLKSKAFIDGKYQDELTEDEHPLVIAKRRHNIYVNKLESVKADTKELKLEDEIIYDKFLAKSVKSINDIKKVN